MSDTKVPFLDLARSYLADKSELECAALEVMRSGVYIHGEHHQSFEREFADYLNTDYCCGVASGTDALEIALRSLGCRAGDEVITAANAGFYASTACLQVGAVPVYADIDEKTLTLDPSSVQAAIGPQTKFIVVTHLYGGPAAIVQLSELAQSYGIALIEDCSHAHGGRVSGRCLGTFGKAGIFSFYPTKNLAALGDGGAIVTNDPEVFESVRRVRQYGWKKRYFSVGNGGRNSRLDEIQAAFLRIRLRKLDDRNEKRQYIARRLAEACLQSDRYRTVSVNSWENHVAHLFVVRVKNRVECISMLKKEGISTCIHYPVADHRQEALVNKKWRKVNLDITEKAAEEVLSIPCNPELTEKEIAHVVRVISQ